MFRRARRRSASRGWRRLSVMVAKGEPVWNMQTRQGTTLYLCLEDSRLRIQNRLFEIMEDARPAFTSAPMASSSAAD